MKKRILVLGLLASSAIGVLAMPADAQQATTTDEVRELRAAVQALQARLDKIDSEQKATAAAVTATAVTATPAAAPVQVAATSAPTGWFDNTTVGGKAYINFSSINQKSDGKNTAQNGVQTDVKRFYLTVDHKFNKVFSANLTTDFRYGSNGLSNDTAVFVKKAYLQATLSPAFYVRIGAADLPWVPFVENVYGYRFVENTLIDRTKYGTSADYGVHIGGTFGNGLVSYAVSAIDGLGFKTRSRSSNTLDIEGRLSAQPIKGATLAIGGYTGKLGKSNDTLPDTNHRATRLDALAAYSTHGVNVGVEYFRATDWNNVTTVLSDRSNGWSTFGSYAFTPKVSVFGRYDWVNPNQRTNKALHEKYFNVGVDFQPIKNIDIAAVYKRDKADNGLISTSNGTIGGAIGGTYDEFGIFTQLKF
jgi:hypothetical protein